MGALSGIGVLVTRPAPQAGPLCRLLEEQGAMPLLFPVVEIVPLRPPDAILGPMAECDLAIFISPNAVIHSVPWIQAAGGWPATWTIAALGAGTARELTQHGAPLHLVPKDQFDSEALLALPRLAELFGQRVLIFRGAGGREFLGEELTRRGARVTYVEVYQRVKPTPERAALLRWLASTRKLIALVTSGEGLRNLYDLSGADGQNWLRTAQLVVFSERIGDVARALGLRGTIHVARPATDAAVIATLIQITKDEAA